MLGIEDYLTGYYSIGGSGLFLFVKCIHDSISVKFLVLARVRLIMLHVS